MIAKIKSIEDEMARTQKNKATEYHLGCLKAKLAKLRTSLMEGESKGSSKSEHGFEARKSGDARIALIGFPSVGKSTLLSTLTNTTSETASYEFTTLTCIPGVINYKGSKIQLLDLPGIIEGASKGKGRGRQVIATARTADLIVMMLDAGKGHIQKKLLTKELNDCGIKINQKRPNITFKERKKGAGGLRYTQTCVQSELSEKLVKRILQDRKIFNVDVIIRYDATIDDFIDVIEGNRQYIRCLFVYNKCDTISIEEVDEISKKKDSIVISCVWKLNLDYLLERSWDALELTRIYTKKKGQAPDLEEPFVIKSGSTVGKLCDHIHADLRKNLKNALVWGTSCKFSPQSCGVDHVLHDEDVVYLSHHSY